MSFNRFIFRKIPNVISDSQTSDNQQSNYNQVEGTQDLTSNFGTPLKSNTSKTPNKEDDMRLMTEDEDSGINQSKKNHLSFLVV